MTDKNNMPDITDAAVKEKPSQIKALIVIALVFLLLLGGSGTGFWFFKIKGNDLPDKPFDTSSLISNPSPHHSADPLADIGSDYTVNDAQTEVATTDLIPSGEPLKVIPDLPASLSDTVTTTVIASVPALKSERLDSIEKSIESLNIQISSLIDLVDAVNLANSKQDKKISALKSSSNKTKSKAKKSSRQTTKSKTYIKKPVLVTKAKPTPPFTFVGVEIWDGESKVVIALNQHVTQLSEGESSNNWVLLKSVYPDKAEFMERKSGHKVILFSDGRRPHGI